MQTIMISQTPQFKHKTSVVFVSTIFCDTYILSFLYLSCCILDPSVERHCLHRFEWNRAFRSFTQLHKPGEGLQAQRLRNFADLVLKTFLQHAALWLVGWNIEFGTLIDPGISRLMVKSRMFVHKKVKIVIRGTLKLPVSRVTRQNFSWRVEWICLLDGVILIDPRSCMTC